MTDAQTPTGHTSDVYIHMQGDEDEAVADCGCRLVMDSLGAMMFFQCPLHKAAPDLLEACQRALSVLEGEPECAIYKAHTDIVRAAIAKATVKA